MRRTRGESGKGARGGGGRVGISDLRCLISDLERSPDLSVLRFDLESRESSIERRSFHVEDLKRGGACGGV